MQSSFEGKTKHLAPRNITDNVLKEFSLKKHNDSLPFIPVCSTFTRRAILDVFLQVMGPSDVSQQVPKGQLYSDLLANGQKNL